MNMDWIEVEGIRVRRVEEGGGDPVVLLHGWGASHRIFDQAIPKLAERYRVIAIDWPGFGDSENPKAPYTIDWYSKFLGRMLDVLSLESPTILGHSMGGAIAAKFAIENPGRIRSLLLVCPLLHGKTGLPFRTKWMLLPGVRHLIYLFVTFLSRMVISIHQPDGRGRQLFWPKRKAERSRTTFVPAPALPL